MAGDCLFCRMADGETEVEKLWDRERVFAINDINPRAPVHLLIISRRHLDSARDLSPANAMLLAEMVQAANSLAEERGIADSGFRLVFNVGENGGQSIQHLHMHLLGGAKLGAEA